MPEDKPPHTPPASDDLPPKVGGVPSSNTPTLPPGVWNIDADGKVYGPSSRQQMRELIADGRLSAASKISKSGEAGWRRADQDPILKQLLTGIEPSDGNESAQSNPMHAAALKIEAGNLEVKSPLLAVILSLIVPGAGQMYTGHITGGVQILVVWIVFVVVGQSVVLPVVAC